MQRPALATARALALSLAGIAALAAPLAAPSVAAAQRASLQIAQGPYFAGVPIDLQVVAEGFEEEPQPEIEVTAPAGATLAFVQARPQVSSFMQIVNGQITQRKEVRFGYVYQLTAPAAGSYDIGPFHLRQGSTEAKTTSTRIRVTELPLAGNQRLRLVVPEGNVFVGQRVPVTIEWWTESGLADRLFNQRMSVPLFMASGAFQFLEDDHEPSRIVVSADTPAGAVDFPADVRQTVEGGKTWVVRSFSRTMIPIAAGRHELGQATLYCDEAVAWRRDFFGSRVPSQVRKQRVLSQPLVVQVEPVPLAGRPPSFAGAIGQGFTMEVAADRSVLQAGDPVRLTFTLRGDGSLDSAALPNLAAAGLVPSRFRVPAGEAAGTLEEGAKKFEVSVRVVDADVEEIPPIAYSWFDPTRGTFETTETQPIALSVREATVVGAGDVVSAEPGAPDDEEETPPAANEAGAGGESRAGAARPAFTLTGADLAIETDAGRLLSPASGLLGSTTTIWIGYGGGLASLLAGLLVARRRRIDPALAARRREMKALRRAVESAASAKELADALRRMAAANTGSRPDDLDTVLAALDETIYAPGGASVAATDELRRRAASVAATIEENVG